MMNHKERKLLQDLQIKVLALSKENSELNGRMEDYEFIGETVRRITKDYQSLCNELHNVISLYRNVLRRFDQHTQQVACPDLAAIVDTPFRLTKKEKELANDRYCTHWRELCREIYGNSKDT